jgi:hypothetical protein
MTDLVLEEFISEEAEILENGVNFTDEVSNLLIVLGFEGIVDV